MCTRYVVHIIFIDYEQALRLKRRAKPAAVGVTLTPNIYPKLESLLVWPRLFKRWIALPTK